MRYRSKPQEVEAVKWDDTDDTVEELWAFTARAISLRFVDDDEADRRTLYLVAGVNGAQGPVPVPVGHWIVRRPGDASDLWPVDPDYFAEKYEAVA